MSKKLPIIIIWDEIPFPNVGIEIEIGREESINALKASKEKNNGYIILISQKKDIETNEIEISDLHKTGVIAKIIKTEGGYDEEIIISLMPEARVVLSSFSIKDKKFISEYKIIAKQKKLNEKEKLLESKLRERLANKLKKTNLPEPLLNTLLNEKDIDILIDTIASYMPIPTLIKQKILDAHILEKRLQIIINQLDSNISSDSIEESIQSKVKGKLNDQQREFYLREKLKAIKEELDEINGEMSEIEELRKKVKDNPYPEYISKKLSKEIDRLEKTPQNSSEAGVIRNYIEWLIDLPWWEKSEEKVDIKKVKKELDKEHFGLDKVKDSIVEFLAVKQINPDAKGSVLALVGPPGTGKTTLGKSIAKALNKKYIKVSLGGVRDEAEMRGHRRTYVGAMPGKIISAMKKARVINPVILLDEIDKMSSDMRGDPASALLEVLDFEQNTQFQDHYIEEEYNLENVMFIATANYMQNIPETVIDRLEIINLSSYTEIEKISISKNYLINHIIKNTKIEESYFKLSDDILKYLIRHYTQEAGVRELRRVLEKVARKIIVINLNKKIIKKFEIDKKLINKFLGPEKYDYSKKEKKDSIGVATGLAWTSVGGDILPIEVNLFPGNGKLILSGQLKDVMKESATVALAFIKANAIDFEIKDETFKKNDIHIHVPDGATPKDGPSAGITFTTAIISALTKKPVSNLIGMTGEITLRGNVFPIGGLKEKSISASRSGLKTIFVPIENKKDLVEIPAEVKKNLEIILVEKYSDVYKRVFK